MFHILALCEFYSILLCHKGTSVHLLSPPLNYWHTSFFFLAGPGPLHESAVSALSRGPFGRSNTFSFLSVLLGPRKPLSVPPLSPCFLALAFPLFLSFLLLLSCTPRSYLRTVSLLGFLLYPSILSRLRYPTLFQLVLLLLSSPISYGWQPLL